ncbi:MAG: GTP-binding protein [Promethearchaeota archaeon]|nr:MAG: GTP-binding protein [Candidatus Lokiarchaeota archaeon]
MSKKDIVFQGKTEHIYKIVIIGDPAVGKTSLLTKFSSNKFEKRYLPTVGVNITKEQIEVENPMGEEVVVNLMMWDVAGQPQFYMLHRPYFNGADGMILVFDVTRSSSFSNIKNWYQTAVKYGLSGIPRILVGNKIDLKDERKIIVPMMEHLGDELNAPYFETSALTGENVKVMFRKIAKLVLESKMKKP